MAEELLALEREFKRFACSVLFTSSDYRNHQDTVKVIRSIARKVIDESATVQMFGSAASFLGERGCDIDATILVDNVHLEHLRRAYDHDVREMHASAINAIAEFINNHAGCGLKVAHVISTAKVPIVVLETDAGQICDVSINNRLPLQNTKLLRNYGLVDDNVKMLIICVKRWAKLMGVCDAKNGALSSYSWTLLCIYYLQVRSEGSLLPSLQQLAIQDEIERKQNAHLEPSTEMSVTESQTPFSAGGCSLSAGGGETTCERIFCPTTGRPLLCHFVSSADRRVKPIPVVGMEYTITSLLRGFFKFYDREYVWGNEVVSIRLGRREKITSHEFQLLQKVNRLGQQMTGPTDIHVEDPFETHRNLNCVLDPQSGRDNLRSAIRVAAEKLWPSDGTCVKMSTLMAMARHLTSAAASNRMNRRQQQSAVGNNMTLNANHHYNPTMIGQQQAFLQQQQLHLQQQQQQQQQIKQIPNFNEDSRGQSTSGNGLISAPFMNFHVYDEQVRRHEFQSPSIHQDSLLNEMYKREYESASSNSLHRPAPPPPPQMSRDADFKFTLNSSSPKTTSATRAV